MFYLLLGIGFVVIFSCMLILNNSIKELDQTLLNVLVKEIKIEEMLKKKDNNEDEVSTESSNEDILKAIRNTYPHMTEGN